MRQGMSLTDFAVEVQRQKDSKRDFKVPSTMMAMAPIQTENLPKSPDGYVIRHAITLPGVGEFPVRRLMHQQLSEKLKIDWRYYERMAEESSPLLALNANYWLHKTEEKRLVRTLDGQARAYLGDTFRPIDNFDLFTAIAPTFLGPKATQLGLRIESIQITETKFFIKAFSDKVTGDVAVGDRVQAGVTITNSEVGHGLIAVKPSVFSLICSNGMVLEDSSLKRRHVGKGSGELEGVEEYFTDATRRADDEAFWRKVVDVVNGSFDQLRLEKTVEKLRAAKENRMVKGGADVMEIREVVQNKYGLTEGEGESMLRHLIERGDLSQYGLANAITRLAQDEGLTYTRASELEVLGGKIVELPRSEWQELAAA